MFRDNRVTSAQVGVTAGFLILALSACGVYTFNPRGKADFESIAVETFSNSTPEFDLADRLTTVVVDALIQDGTFKVVRPDLADAVLNGTLVRYERLPYTFNENDQVENYRVVIGFELVLRNPRDGTDIWKESVTQEGIFDAATETEEIGQERAGERLVQTILNRTTKSW